MEARLARVEQAIADIKDLRIEDKQDRLRRQDKLDNRILELQVSITDIQRLQEARFDRLEEQVSLYATAIKLAKFTVGAVILVLTLKLGDIKGIWIDLFGR